MNESNGLSENLFLSLEIPDKSVASRPLRLKGFEEAEVEALDRRYG